MDPIRGGIIDFHAHIFPAARPSRTDTVNRWLAERQDSRFMAFGTLHPSSKDVEADLVWNHACNRM